MTSTKTITSGLKAALIISGIVFAAGCSSTAQIEQAQSDAARALEAAQQAQRTADQALEAARAAQATANEAENCCEVQTERLDRALERMQQK